MNERAPTETWRPIPGHPRYEVSDHGRVRSVFADSAPRVLKTYTTRGYVGINLGSTARDRVHRLVLEAFVGPCPPNHEAAHLNGVRNDNRAANLAWVTGKENASHREIHGTHLRGSRSPLAKLSESDIPMIWSSYNQGISMNAIARQYNVSRSAIQLVLARKTWAHIEINGGHDAQ